jgi:hypothetical protein
MNAHFETNGIFPLSTVPLESYNSDPASRGGNVVIIHLNRKFIKVLPEGGHELVEKASDATQFDNHTDASLAAAGVLDYAKKHPVELVD